MPTTPESRALVRSSCRLDGHCTRYSSAVRSQPCVRAAQLVGRPVALVELQRDDVDRAVPAHRPQPHRGAILAARDRLDECIQIRRRLAVDFDDAAAGPELIARRRRAVREVRDEHAVGLRCRAAPQARDAASAARRPPTRSDAIEIAPAERDGRHVERLLRAVAQHRHAHRAASARRARLRGSDSRSRRRCRESDRPSAAAALAGEPPTRRATLSTWRRSGLCCFETLRPTHPAGRACGHRRAASAAAPLRANAARVPSRTSGSISTISSAGMPRFSCAISRPASYAKLAQVATTSPFLFDEHAVVVARAVHERDRFQIGVAELQRARQRERDRIDRRDASPSATAPCRRRACRPPTPARPAAARAARSVAACAGVVPISVGS